MSINNIFMLHGDEYLVDEKLKAIINDITAQTGSEPELVFINDDDMGIDELQDNLHNSSLFGLARVIIIKNPWWLQKAPRKTAKIKEINEVFTEYFLHDYPEQFLIVTTVSETFTDKKGKKSPNNPVLKLFIEKTKVIECPPFKNEALRKWLINRFEIKGLQVDQEAVNILAASGQDLFYLDNLIEKLSLSKINRITTQHLQGEWEDNNEYTVFQLTDALFAKNIDSALFYLHRLIEQGLGAGLFIAMINNQFISLGKVKAALENGCDRNQLAAVTKLHPYAAGKMQPQARKFNWGQLWDIFSLILAADIKMKTTGQDEQLLMEALIIEICNK